MSLITPWYISAGKTLLAHWRILTLITVLLIAGIVVLHSCGRSKPKLNEAEIQKAEQAIKTRDMEELKTILVNAEVKEAAIDGNLSNAKQRTVQAADESRRKYEGMSIEEMEKLLEERK
jgi:hypothetical protein